MLMRVRALLAALWSGFLLCVAGVAAPVAFGVLARPEAGRYVGRLFELDAQLGLVLGLLLVMMERRVQRDAESARITTPELLLPLGALFCVVLGYYGLQPLMAEARAGQGALSFGALHGISSGIFALKALLVLSLAWRTSRR
ncbi:DUF4149 domain-containing protein [Pelomonas sp. BJYL3]|uniref:DUF4149 domain-containing protein n=1 Tax=Pelomonas sp. BJYL3 TaxID=2976697 RepID=UPI0022B34999|nr:DUF4149 domain-containing protein [Pelomonas sp. BJYL3]